MTEPGESRRETSGVMGYVAELQQFDQSMTVDEPSARDPEPEPAIEPVLAPVRVPEKLPWTRIEVVLAVVFVIVAATVVMGGAYALMERRRPTGEVALPLPMVVPSRPAASPPAEGVASPTPTAGVRGESRQRTSPGAGPVPASPTPESATSAPVAAADLHASYARAANTGLLGLGGYRGEVTVRNEGAGAARDWQVTLSLPAGLEVSGASGAQFAQDGTLVIFTPEDGAAAVPPGGSVAFTFDVPGLLAGEPTGCAIDGRACA
ncbi:cellulose binding domain-containing protein [Micromonospora sp. CPCC 206061]|uniref:cellulose binding domain-containing protein n=1 Tax=Micromonospora sp. CPCC 206061 TaxID=3122410 RepID=UPI002FF1CFBE